MGVKSGLAKSQHAYKSLLSRGMSPNHDYQDARMPGIREYPDNLKIPEILVQATTL